MEGVEDVKDAIDALLTPLMNNYCDMSISTNWTNIEKRREIYVKVKTHLYTF